MSKIEWLKGGKTWNPVTGCTKTSRGCRNCYAARMSKRLAGRCGYPKDHPFRVTLHPDRVDIPYRWKETRRVFVCSMGDLFHPNVPFDFIDRIFDTIWHTPRHRYLILTKRTDRMVEYIQERAYRRTFGWTNYGRGAYYPGRFEHYEDIVMRDMCGYRGDLDENQNWLGCNHPEIAGLPDEYEKGCSPYECPIASIASDRESLEKIGVADDYEFEPDGEGGEYALDCEWMRINNRPRHAWPGNLCLGFSAEDQKTFEDRIGDFFVLRRNLPKEAILFMSYEPALGPIDTNIDHPYRWSPLLDTHLFEMGSQVMRRPYLDWVIAGCETGPGARPMDPDWIRSIRDQCREARIPFFLKKLDPKGERMLDGRMWEETPFENENDALMIHTPVKKIFVCSPYTGDIQQNQVLARRICAKVRERGGNPFAPHLFYTQFLDEKNRKERDAGIALGLDFMRVCDEVLVFRGNGVSAGMKREIAHAERLSLPITYVGDGYL